MTRHRVALGAVGVFLVVGCASSHASPPAEPVMDRADRDAATPEPEVPDVPSASSAVIEPLQQTPHAAPDSSAPDCASDAGDVDARWMSVRPLVLRCSAHHPAGAKPISITFTIAPSGDTTQVLVEGAPDALASCLRGVVATLHFCPGQHPITVSRSVNQ